MSVGGWLRDRLEAVQVLRGSLASARLRSIIPHASPNSNATLDRQLHFRDVQYRSWGQVI